MMKKMLTLMLSFMLALSLAACGDVDDEGNDSFVPGGTQNGGEQNPEGNHSATAAPTGQPDNAGSGSTENGLAEFLKSVSLVEVPTWLPDSGWQFSGGMLDDQEMSQEDAESVLAQYGGLFQIVYGSNGSDVQMIQGGGNLEGSYQKMEDNYTVGIIFNNGGSELKYVAMFTEPEPGFRVMLLFPDDSGKNAFYFTHIEEG